MLGNVELQNPDDASYVCRDTNGAVQVLLWDLTAPTQGDKISDQDYFFHPHPAKAKQNVSIRLSGIWPGNYRLTVYRIGYDFNDPYSRYLELGSPADLSPAMAAELKIFLTENSARK